MLWHTFWLFFCTKDGGVGYYIVDNAHIVRGCPCNQGRKYEDFIINHRHEIAKYLNDLAKDLKEDAVGCEVKKGLT